MLNDEYALYTEEKEDNYLPTLPENRNWLMESGRYSDL
jgi:hypothetical protein